ncbi:hypothetical protein WN51_01948 [Melipona quadrifasciata]|uniref:Uncharacterized protein n=1 Tax=Melipona quadrifasciata TaxID=166423 RepID=A0A0M9AAR4_9HYME|nr:hypothetical protein WN51_01948 [Melipona quadrifasciata]
MLWGFIDIRRDRQRDDRKDKDGGIGSLGYEGRQRVNYKDRRGGSSKREKRR